MSIWELATNVSAKKRAPVVFLTLTGKAREAVLEMDTSELDTDEGLSNLYVKLDGLFKEDKGQATLNCYEKFEKYCRPKEMSLADFRVEFDRLVQQLKSYSIELPDAVLAYRALKSANVSVENEKLVRATVSEVTLKAVMSQLQKVVGVDVTQSASEHQGNIKVKQEPDVNLASVPSEPETAQQESESTEEAYYGAHGYGSRWNTGRGSRRSQLSRRPARGSRWNRGGRGAKKNPPGPDGETSTCRICGSFMH